MKRKLKSKLELLKGSEELPAGWLELEHFSKDQRDAEMLIQPCHPAAFSRYLTRSLNHATESNRRKDSCSRPTEQLENINVLCLYLVYIRD